MGRVFSVVLAMVVCVGAVTLTWAPSPALAQSSFQDEIANLRSPNVGTRVKAAKALGKSGRPEAIPALTQAMRDPEVKVRRESVKALRTFTSSEAVDGFLIGLQDEDKVIRRDALIAVLEIYVGAGNAEMESTLGWITGDRQRTPGLKGLVPVDQRVEDAVATRLQDEEPAIRRRAAYTLGVLGAESAVAALGSSLYDGDKSVRREAIHALAQIGSDEAGEALRDALGGAANDLTGDVVDALGHMKYKPAAPQLITIYDSNVNKLGDRALAALSQMGAAEARGVFYYQMTSKNADQRRWAVEGLGRLNDPGMVPGLIKDFLREPDPLVQLAYCFALANLGNREFVDRVALDLGNKKRRQQAREYAVELGDDFLDEFVAYLADPVALVRMEMARVLMEIGDPRAIPHLEPLLADPDSEVADSANVAIARLRQGRMSASVDSVP
jgi:HEAT repeat protein